MKAIFESVISRGGFKLEDMLARIEMFAANGKLTLDEMNELSALARKKANAIDEINVGKAIVDLSLRVFSLERRCEELEERISQMESSGGEENEKPSETVVNLYPEYVVGTPTIAGDKWSWKGKNYTVINATPENPCVWSPEGYPAYWQLDEKQPE